MTAQHAHLVSAKNGPRLWCVCTSEHGAVFLFWGIRGPQGAQTQAACWVARGVTLMSRTEVYCSVECYRGGHVLTHGKSNTHLLDL